MTTTVVPWTHDTDLSVPGAYSGVPEQLYHALPYCSSSRLRRMLARSPYCVRREIDERVDALPTSAMRTGTSMHIAMLEPDHFVARVRQVKDFRAAASKALAEDMEASGGVAINAAEMRLLDDLRSGRGVPTDVRDALAILDHRELSIISVIEGVPVKARLDGLSVEHGVLLDVKTGQAGADEMARKLHVMRYDLQLGLYAMLAESALGVGIMDVLIVGVMQDYPVEARLYRVADDVIESGQRLARVALEQWRECEQSGKWPLAHTEMIELRYSAWAARELEMLC